MRSFNTSWLQELVWPRMAATLVLGLLSVAALTGRSEASGGTLAVIVHENSPVTSLTVAEFRKVLLGETSEWPDGKRVVLVERDQTSGALRTTLRLICKMTPLEYKRHLLAIEFQGGRVPLEKILNSDEAAAKFVRSVPGAIGVVENSSLAAVQHVKVVRLGGKLPGEPGYFLQ